MKEQNQKEKAEEERNSGREMREQKMEKINRIRRGNWKVTENGERTE